MEQHIVHIPPGQWLHQGFVMQAVYRFDYFLYGTEQVVVFHTGQKVFGRNVRYSDPENVI